MSTAVLQLVSSVLLLSFALAALAVARRTPDVLPRRWAAWWTCGVGFALLGASSVGQAVWALAALREGEATPIYDSYVRLSPGFNHSRATAGVALGLLLAHVAWSRRDPSPRLPGIVLGTLLAATLAGFALVWPEGAMDLSRHGPPLVTLYAVELVVFGLALLAGAMRGGMDATLFGSLALYALLIASAVPTISAMAAWVAGPEGWAVPQFLQAQNTLVHGSMFVLALLRLAVLRGTLRPPRFLRPPERRPRSVVDLAWEEEEASESRARRGRAAMRPGPSPGG